MPAENPVRCQKLGTEFDSSVSGSMQMSPRRSPRLKERKVPVDEPSSFPVVT